MLKIIKAHFKNTVLLIDLIKGRFKSKNKLKIGWCGVFPPFNNGAAVVSYYFVNEFMKNEDVELFAIPLHKKISKSLFQKLKITTIGDSGLDCIILWCLGDNLQHILKKVRVPTIAWQTMHNLPEKENNEQKLLNELKKIDKVITMTKWAQKAYKKYSLNTEYLPFGIDTNIFTIEKKDGLEVVFVSRMHYYKGIIPFLESIPFVLNKYPEVIFRVQAPFDKNSPFLDEIRLLIEETKFKFPNNFFYNHDWLDYNQIPEFYKKSSILVFPSDNEGFGIPLIEAMACGNVCIVTNKPPMNEIVENKSTGFCLDCRKDRKEYYHGFEFPHPEEIAKTINYLIENKSKLKQMGEKAREKVLKEYSLEKCAKRMISTIRSKVKQ